MRYHKFRVDVFYPPEYRNKFYEILSEEKKVGDVNYLYVVEETAPPPEMLKDACNSFRSGINNLKDSLRFP